MGTTYIYGLCEPGTEHVRYVGKADDPNARYSAHLTQARGYCRSRKCRWLRSIMSDDKTPNLIILEKVDKKYWSLRERAWIKHFRDEGNDLVNRAHMGARVSIRMDSDLRDRVKRDALDHGENMSQTISRLLKIALDGNVA